MIIIDEVSMIRADSVPETPFYGTECITFQKSAAQETASVCTERSSEVFGDRNALVVCEVKRRMRPLRSGARFEDADGCSYNAAAVSSGDCCVK